jgi:hypothetical protein
MLCCEWPQVGAFPAQGPIAGLRQGHLSPPLRGGIRSWRSSKWRLSARLVDDVELAVKVVAEQLVRTFYQPWPYPIEGDQFGDVEYALDKAGWQQHQPGASDHPSA